MFSYAHCSIIYYSQDMEATIHIHIHTHIYIYKERERETERDREREKAWQPTPIFLPRKSHEENPQRRLVGYNT